mmetsp:Transcript_10953/g.20229  ORF Transcript_10953/g.20229 Transcript_10953/m.20229 type:complete len:121 (-) Transcript_10953:2720-3082(-)
MLHSHPRCWNTTDTKNMEEKRTLLPHREQRRLLVTSFPTRTVYSNLQSRSENTKTTKVVSSLIILVKETSPSDLQKHSFSCCYKRKRINDTSKNEDPTVAHVQQRRHVVAAAAAFCCQRS